MKTISKLALFAVLLVSGFTSQAITNTAIAVSGTNVVLSWPSYGYESYLVQYRQTLNPDDSWSCLTNAYHANSTNRTTLTLYGAVTGSGGNGGSFMARTTGESAYDSMAAGPLAMPIDVSGGGAPVAIYPPGFDFSNFNIFDPLSGDTVSGVDYVRSAPIQQTMAAQDILLPSDDPQPLDGGSGNSSDPTTGFFRVFHIPSFRANFSGYTFNGPTFIPVDYAAPDADLNYVEDTTVLIGGQPTDHTQFMSYDINGVTYWGVAVYFDRFPNGTNTIQLITTVRQSDVISDQTPYMVFSNAPAAINIGNLITYTNWDDLVPSGGYTFKAQSSVPNVNWEIDIYDWNGNFVNYQTGYSSDGNISWTWDLTDYNGASRGNFDSDPAFFPYITITGNLPSMAQGSGAQPNAGNSSASTWAPPFGNQYPSIGGWVFSYMDRFYLDGTPNTFADSCMHSGLNNLVGGPAAWSEPVALYPLKFGLNYPQSDRDNSWTNFATYLYYSNNRNLYYFGHGNANSIGGDYNITDANGTPTGAWSPPGSKAEITARYIHDKITFNQDTGPRRYRFIYLDCCNGAATNSIMPWAFDVPKQQEPLSYYHSASNTSHGRPSAFVGWDTIVGGPGWGTPSDFWNCRSYWMSSWALTFQADLDAALYDGNDFSNWVPASQFASHIRIFGYSIMIFDDYNFGGDWSY
jgi:hypothetical protein